ncbi:transketolase 1-like [Nylanderia fulva]|uniref:transketolase 1-like n=1 Tax=Nylanderia fulva TaxID=613905 RepID=UPI0010FAFF9E|nr:transketolase 1-like [Nylanderia fulva]
MIHSKEINCVELDESKKLIVTGSKDKTVKVMKYSITSGGTFNMEDIFTLKGHKRGVWSVSIGTELMVSSGSDNTIRNLSIKEGDMDDPWEVINNIRIICVEMVERARSGHPGTPLGLAPFVFKLFSDHLRFDPDDPSWIDRDVFILSNGHACALQYVMYHLIGYDISMDDLKSFRRVGSKTPGHPEREITPGIEVTTGPLGQGVANAVGVAIAQQKLRCHNNGDPLFSGKVYCIFGDGCYQEGISEEAFSIASHYNLNNLVFIYDSNKTTIDGPTSLSMTSDPVQRFKALNFEIVHVVDGNEDIKSMGEALSRNSDRPMVIILETSIGRGSKLEGDSKAHGEPLGKENVDDLKRKFGLMDGEFHIRECVYKHFKEIKEKNRKVRGEWNKLKSKYLSQNGKKCNLMDIKDIFEPEKINLEITYQPSNESIATRKHFSNALNEFAPHLKNLFGGAADLTKNVLTKWSGCVEFTRDDRSGSYIRYGIREHGMFGIMNGISSLGVHLPYGGTFLNFVTYGFPSVRLAALSSLRAIYVLTHDSIGLGEDGPTHQPIETLALLRATPNLVVFRPFDGLETRFSLRYAIERRGPTAIVLSRQNVSEISHSSLEKMSKGAYYLIEHKDPELIILSTGSEVPLSREVVELLHPRRVSLVSFLSFELFEDQPLEYKNYVLPKDVPKVSIEALSTFGWHKYSDFQIGVDKFGMSGNYKEVFEYFEFTPNKLKERILLLLKDVDP